MANFIPPANGASQGNYFQAKIPKIAIFEAFSSIMSRQKLQNGTDRFKYLNLNLNI